MDQKTKLPFENNPKKPGDYPETKKRFDQKGSSKEGHTIQGSLKGHNSRGRG
jgi:hypothetical protein